MNVYVDGKKALSVRYTGEKLQAPSGANTIEVLAFSADKHSMKVRNGNGTETWMPVDTDLSDWTPVPPPIPASEVRVTDPKTGGQKGRKPEAYALIPAWPLAEVARVYHFGAYGKPTPYEAWNWLKGYDWSLSLSALGRHIEAFKMRRPGDPESRLHDLAHAVFHCLTLMEFERLKLGTDDRQPLPGALPEKEIDGGGL